MANSSAFKLCENLHQMIPFYKMMFYLVIIYDIFEEKVILSSRTVQKSQQNSDIEKYSVVVEKGTYATTKCPVIIITQLNSISS